MAAMKTDDFDGSEVSPSQAVALVGAPTFPNCVKFSETNLLAVASGHLVTILDPAALSGPRGFIPVAASSLFDVGSVEQEGLQAGSLLPHILFRDPRPGVRSMDWSPSGLAQNGGCLLAICTTDNRVKVYREPFSDFQSDWVENIVTAFVKLNRVTRLSVDFCRLHLRKIIDFSEMAYNYCVGNDFRECELVTAEIAMQEDSMPRPSDWGLPVKRKDVEEHEEVDEPQHRKMRRKNHDIMTEALGVKDVIPAAGQLQQLPSDNPAVPIDTNRPPFEPVSSPLNTSPGHEKEGSLWELAVVSPNAPESASSAALERNAGADPRLVEPVSETLNGEAFLTCDESHAATSSHSRGQECVHGAGDAVFDFQGDDDLNENLASVLARAQERTKGCRRKVYGRRRPARGTNLAMDSRGTSPNEGTCPQRHISERLARTRNLPLRFLEGAEVVEEIISESFPDDSAPAEHVGGDVNVIEAVKEHVNSSEAKSDGFSYLPSSLKHARRHARMLKSKPDEKITNAADYVARTELLSPLAVAWSPKCQASERADGVEMNKPHSFALLGAGTKSGRVGIWRMMYPRCYSTDHVRRPVEGSFLGFLEAHKSWVTSLCWASCDFDLGKVNMVSPDNLVSVSREKLLLVTGCADGSVKIWAAGSESLINASSTQALPIAFCKQVGKADSVPVTSLALVVLSQPRDRALLAAGKGSGSLAIYEITASGACHQLCHQDVAHQQTVTGLSWSFDGRCLYSCGQDSLKIWELLKAGLEPLQLPDWSPVFPIIISPDLCSADAMESFYGVALSHNCLALVTVRDLDSDALDQMYQARSQKAVVQMFWLGIKPTDGKTRSVRVPKGMTVNEIAGWKVNILSALQHLEDPKEALVLWDVMAALSLLKEAVGGEVIVAIFSQWLTGWTRGEDAVGAVESTERPSGQFEKAVSEASCRQLHILNVIYRRLLLVHLKPEALNTSSYKNVSPTQTGTVTREEKLWRKCIYLVEHELRQRLVHLRLCIAILKEEEFEHEQQDGFSGTRLNENWVLDNSSSVYPELSKVATQLRKSRRNLFRSISETCPFCDCTVALDSPETANCQRAGTGHHSHQLQRCSVSMQVCTPACQWYCSCCKRRAMGQAPSLFFGLSSRSRIYEVATHALLRSYSNPGCPFCGVLMHRLLPGFFLTPSLV